MNTIIVRGNLDTVTSDTTDTIDKQRVCCAIIISCCAINGKVRIFFLKPTMNSGEHTLTHHKV